MVEHMRRCAWKAHLPWQVLIQANGGYLPQTTREMFKGTLVCPSCLIPPTLPLNVPKGAWWFETHVCHTALLVSFFCVGGVKNPFWVGLQGNQKDKYNFWVSFNKDTLVGVFYCIYKSFKLAQVNCLPCPTGFGVGSHPSGPPWVPRYLCNQDVGGASLMAFSS